MPLLGSRNLCSLVFEDRGTFLWDGAGNTLATLPALPPGPERRLAWAEAIRENGPAKPEVQVLFAHGDLEVACHEVPYLPPRERRDAALSLLLASDPTLSRPSLGVALDPDPAAKGGHVMWVATYPAHDMYDAISAIEAAGGRIVYAAPVQRLFLRALDQAGTAPGDRLLLAVEHQQGRIAYFRGRSLGLLRTFRLPEGEGLQEEVLAEEIGRTLQFIKQRQRTAPPSVLHAVGIGRLDPALKERLQRSPGLTVKELAPAAATFILAGARAERAEAGGMNLVPLHILETRKRQLFRALTWAAAGLLVLLCLTAAGVVKFQASQLDQEAAQAEANLQIRQRLLQESDQVARARLPLLRLRDAEAIQRTRAHSLGRLAETLFAAPRGVTLDTVEVREAADPTRLEFLVSGTALSEEALSTAPLARYLDRIQALPGAALAPLETVQVEDLSAEGAPADQAPAKRAAARFTLRGTVP
ncbi:MAG TPA: hypothetical protein VFM16_01225 [Holophagaceae bacterium]|nr:hypothetical protein [Holophagaceae bacterium]